MPSRIHRKLPLSAKNKIHSGLLRYEAKGDLDWWHVARDIAHSGEGELRRDDARRQRPPKHPRARPREGSGQEEGKSRQTASKPARAQQGREKRIRSTTSRIRLIVTPETQPGKGRAASIEFRSDQWAEIYSKRIDETIAALKSKGVPVFWVGLAVDPRHEVDRRCGLSQRSLPRRAPKRAGVIYIDVWDGFVDEAGKYSNFGPDYEGQMRRLRSSDGVFFHEIAAR